VLETESGDFAFEAATKSVMTERTGIYFNRTVIAVIAYCIGCGVALGEHLLGRVQPRAAWTAAPWRRGGMQARIERLPAGRKARGAHRDGERLQ
jgi:hypothetical protein